MRWDKHEDLGHSLSLSAAAADADPPMTAAATFQAMAVAALLRSLHKAMTADLLFGSMMMIEETPGSLPHRRRRSMLSGHVGRVFATNCRPDTCPKVHNADSGDLSVLSRSIQRFLTHRRPWSVDCA